MSARPPAWHYAEADQLLREAAREVRVEYSRLKIERAKAHAALAQCSPDIADEPDDSSEPEWLYPSTYTHLPSTTTLRAKGDRP